MNWELVRLKFAQCYIYKDNNYLQHAENKKELYQEMDYPMYRMNFLNHLSPINSSYNIQVQTKFPMAKGWLVVQPYCERGQIDAAVVLNMSLIISTI